MKVHCIDRRRSPLGDPDFGQIRMRIQSVDKDCSTHDVECGKACTCCTFLESVDADEWSENEMATDHPDLFI